MIVRAQRIVRGMFLPCGRHEQRGLEPCRLASAGNQPLLGKARPDQAHADALQAFDAEL